MVIAANPVVTKMPPESVVILESVFFECSFTFHLHHGLVNILNQ